MRRNFGCFLFFFRSHKTLLILCCMQCSAISGPVLLGWALPLTEADVASEALAWQPIEKKKRPKNETRDPRADIRRLTWRGVGRGPASRGGTTQLPQGARPLAYIRDIPPHLTLVHGILQIFHTILPGTYASACQKDWHRTHSLKQGNPEALFPAELSPACFYLVTPACGRGDLRVPAAVKYCHPTCLAR